VFCFLKRSGSEVILTHNSWMGFLSQTMTQTLAVNGDLMTINAATPGLIGSATDFGYNNKGIMFNETTHRMSRARSSPWVSGSSGGQLWRNSFQVPLPIS